MHSLLEGKLPARVHQSVSMVVSTGDGRQLSANALLPLALRGWAT